MLECLGGISIPLFTIQGSCQAVGIELDTEHIPFGGVVRGAQSTRKLVMYNTGDIGARFRWDETSFLPDFSISPVEGYVATAMHVDFTITFHPTQHNRDVRYDNLVCNIEDGTQLYLTLTGACIPATPTKEVREAWTTESYSVLTYVLSSDIVFTDIKLFHRGLFWHDIWYAI